MAEVIKVSTEEMRVCIAKYMTEKGKLLNALQICMKASNLLMRSWAGPSFTICCAKMAKTFKNLSEVDAKINDAISELNKTIANMEQAEGKIKSDIGSLDQGTSPFA